MSLGYANGTSATQTFSFSQAVTDPVLMFNYVDRATYDFSGLTMVASPITYSSSAVQGSLASNGILSITSANNAAGDGFSVRLLGNYTSASSFSISLTSPGYDSVGFGIATLTAQLPNTPNTPNPPALPDIVSGNNRVGSTGFNLLSNVAGAATFNNRFDGGTIKVDSTTATSALFSITGNKGFIDQNGTAGTFSGVISNDGSATGRLVILNTAGALGSRAGRVILAAANTYSGGTEVQAGATLQIASAAALGSGRLDLVGSSTESATLAVTATTTIANNITVAGDPTFDVASGTTTTVTGVIANGTAVGDVVKTGLGTLELTAANTYTGPTAVSQGTLKLSGAGAVANSTAVTNNATLDVAQATGNVSLGGSYTQAAAGVLKMTVAAVNNQQLNVAGAASVNGTLDLTAATGTYRTGRYTLVTSAGLNASTFSAFNTNLANVTAHSFKLGYDATNVYLELRSSAADTLRSIQTLGAELNQVTNAQYGIAQLGLSYDCQLFDERNLCLSTGARSTQSLGNGTTYQGVALIAAYRVQPKIRVGGWLDQNESRHLSRNVTEGSSTPMFGAFAVWNDNPQTGQGLEFKLSAAHGQKDLTLSRQVFGTSELGSGSSKLSTTMAEATLGYGVKVNERSLITPFAGLRYAHQSTGAYAEKGDVFSPLSFAKVSQSAKSAIAGVNLFDKPAGPVGLHLTAGVEHYLSTTAGQISAAGIEGLSAVQLSPVMSSNRAFASASLSFDVAKNQQLLVGLSHSKQFTNSSAVNSGTVRYVIGL